MLWIWYLKSYQYTKMHGTKENSNQNQCNFKQQ